MTSVPDLDALAAEIATDSPLVGVAAADALAGPTEERMAFGLSASAADTLNAARFSRLRTRAL